MSEHGYGGFWIRFLAMLVDSVIVMTVLVALLFAVITFLPAAMPVMTIVYFFAPFLYFVVMHASARQATYGKALLGMVVTSSDGERISLLRSLGRELGKFLSALPLALGYVIAAFTERKQALHDFVATTTVVRHDTGRVFLGVLIGVFGWLAPVAIIFVAGAGMFLTQFQKMNAGVLQTAGIAADSTAPSDSSVVQASMPTAARPNTPTALATASSASPAGGPADAVFAARLPGIEEKPGMVRAGPVLVELSTIFGNTFWIKTYLPPLKEFESATPVVSLSQVTDSKGTQLYDPAHQLETPFFQKVTLSSWKTPVPHLRGTRSVNLKDGASAKDVQRVEGKVTLSIPNGAGKVEREFPFVLTKDAAAAPVASTNRAATVASNARAETPRTETPRTSEPPAPRTEPAAQPVTRRLASSRPVTRQPVVSALDPEAVAALDQLSPRFATEVALVPARFQNRPVQLYDFGAVPRGVDAARVFWPIHGFDAAGNPVAIRGQRPIFTAIPRIGDYSGLWKLVYVVTADLAQPNALSDAAAVEAAVRAKRATLRDAGVVLNLPLVPRGTTLARDTTRAQLGWYKGWEVQFFDFGAATPAQMLTYAAPSDGSRDLVVLAGDPAAEVRNLQIAIVDEAPAPRASSPLRAFADTRTPSPPRLTRSP